MSAPGTAGNTGKTGQARRAISGVAAVAMIATLVTLPAAAEETAAATPLPVAQRRLIVSIPDRRLVVVENDRIIETFAVAVGAATTPSPVGTFTVVNRLEHPTYYRPGKVVPPGPRNPLGTRWIGLNVKGYGIHGTDSPQSIGYAKSSGCIRLRNDDVERLFELVRTGDIVELHGERTAAIERFFAVDEALP